MKPSTRSTIIKIGILVVWVVLFVAMVAGYIRSGITANEIPTVLHDWTAASGPWGPLFFIAAYTVRPLTLLPASIPSAAAGLIWGPTTGLFYTLIGENLSAAFAFYLARFLGRDWLVGFRDHPLVKRVDTHLIDNGIMTVLLMRLVFVPFDLLNFACGLTKMRFIDYAIGTFIGIIPGVLMFVLFGSAWADPRNLVISGVLLVGSFVIARFVKNSQLGRRLLEIKYGETL